ncbi:hypothetical protein [Aquirufa nivalisilvae]|nr:hypothetical protein [Aquirufa nivalisilvae]
MKENKELISFTEVKEVWAKPEVELVSVKENTLGAFGVGADNGIFS